MAVLGQFGIIELSREWPAPTALADERLQRGSAPSLDLTDPAFQSGDEVLLVSMRGVPLGIGINGAAPCPDGHAFYSGGATAVGPAVAARTAGGAFYGSNPSLPFYESASTVGFQQTATAFIHRDELDDVRFYSTELDAINGDGQGLIPLRNVSPGPMLILPASSAAGYAAAALQLLQSIADLEIPDGEQPAENLAPVPQVLSDTAADVAQRGWLRQCDLTSWVFEMDAATLDQDAIGQAFGESAKGVLRGAGSFDGEVDHSYTSGEQSGLAMLKLMMLTQQGSKARARFQLLDQRGATLPLVPERVFYETDILLGKTSVNASATDVITMSAQFIATGRIRLATDQKSVVKVPAAVVTVAALGFNVQGSVIVSIPAAAITVEVLAFSVEGGSAIASAFAIAPVELGLGGTPTSTTLGAFAMDTNNASASLQVLIADVGLGFRGTPTGTTLGAFTVNTANASASLQVLISPVDFL